MNLLTRSRSRLFAGLCLAVVIIAVATYATPRPPALATSTKGDAELIAKAQPLLNGTKDRVSIGMIDGDTVRTAHFGADDDTAYEIGSITKTFNAHLLADAVERGEVNLQTRAGQIRPELRGTPVGDVTLEELASHRSGLANRIPGLRNLMQAYKSSLMHSNPYPWGVETFYEQSRGAKTNGKGEYEYSNFGASLLGQLLATKTGMPYEKLATKRIFTSVGMPGTTVPVTADRIPDDATGGYTDGGFPSDPWPLGAEAPSGGAYSTVDDMLTYATAVLDGSVPGKDATRARWNAGENNRIGLAWHETEKHGRTITWHNGATGGFSAILAIDRSADRAVVILSNTATSVDDAGFALLNGQR